MCFLKSTRERAAWCSMHNGEEPKELSGMQSQSLSKIRHHLTMLYTLRNSRLEVMEIIIKSIIGLKIVLTP